MTRSSRPVDGGPAAVACARCGETRDEPALTWVSSVERGATRWYCERCAREHLRSIEGRLDAQWWA